MVWKTVFAPLALLALVIPNAPARAQCPAPGYDGDEPPEFSHYVDRDADGACDRVAVDDGSGGTELVLVVALQDNGVHPNGFYPDCDVDGDGAIVEADGDQIGHGHWEYTHLQQDPRAEGDQPSETEEKDWFTLPQAMTEDFANRDPNGTESRESFARTMRFVLNEPVRFDRFLRPSANPTGRYWQVDEWVGPEAAGQALPFLTWTERFFVCADEAHMGSYPCTTIGGADAHGAYWSNHAAQVGYVEDCGDPFVATPDPERSAECGAAFTSCP